MKKSIIILISLFTIILLNSNISMAKPSAEVEEEFEGFVYMIVSQGLNKETLAKIIDKYRQLSVDYTNEEISEMLEKAKISLKKETIEKEHIDNIENINKLLKNFSSEDLNRIIDTVDIDQAISEMTAGSSIMDLVKNAANNMTTQQKAGLFASIVVSSKIFHTVSTIILILAIYKLFTRCVIYKKAKQHAWAVLIPIYREVVMLRICGMNPWWLLLIFVPIIGWFVLWLVHVASRFMLAEAFKKREWFGLGLWLLWPVFESILVFSVKTKYIGFNNKINEKISQ